MTGVRTNSDINQMSYPAVASPIHQNPYPLKLKPDDIKKADL